MKSWRVWGLLVLLSAPAALPQTNTPVNRATSVSRQFIVFAPGMTLPAALCVFAENLKHEWVDRLNLTGNWRDPIVLSVRENARTNTVSAPINLAIVQVGPIVKYEISTGVPPPMEQRELAAAIIQALCFERANRNRPQGTATNWAVASIPLWFTRGLSESISGRPEWLVQVARRSAGSARPASAAAIMRTTTLPRDELSRELFAANAWLLTEGLLRLPGGAHKLQHLLDEYAWIKTGEEAFWQVYRDDFVNLLALETWWVKQQARLAAVVIPQNLSSGATTKQLDELLSFPEGLRFNGLERYSEQKWLKEALAGKMRELHKLLGKGHPQYRVVIEKYIEAGEFLGAEKVSRYRQAVREADKLRGEVDRQVRDINAVLDHAEHAYSDSMSTNSFQGYFRTLEEAEKFEQQRRNPISDYLDKFDK